MSPIAIQETPRIIISNGIDEKLDDTLIKDGVIV